MSTESRFISPFSQADIARLVIIIGRVNKAELPNEIKIIPRVSKSLLFSLKQATPIIPPPAPAIASPTPVNNTEY